MKTSYHRDAATGVGQRTFDWPVRPPQPRKLLCLPYAGGTSTAFRPVAQALGPAWTVTSVDLPGHGLGAIEAPLESVPDLCQVIDAQVDPARYADGYLLGYSLGGYMAHGLMTRWETDGRPRPRGVIMVAVNPPRRRHLHPVYSELDDDALWTALDELGGLPNALRNDRLVFNMFKHVVRAGFRAYETAPEPNAVIEAPVLAVGASQDTVAATTHLAEWRAYCRRLRIDEVDGPHIFLPEKARALAQSVTEFADSLEEDPI